MATLSRMHVELIARADKYQRDMSRAQAATDRFRNAIVLMGGAAGIAVATKRVFELGSTVEETGSKFRTVFGQSTGEVDAFIAKFGTLAGLSREQAQAVVATTGSIAQGMGIAQRASAAFAVDVTKLAGDLASFNNVPIAETSRAVQAALTGERESLKRLGIVILETDVQKRALIDTGKSHVSQITQEEKAYATLKLITERAGVAVGDLARTSDSAANRARALQAEIRTLAESLSVALLPAMAFVLEKVIAFVGGMKIWIAEIRLGWATLQFWKESLIGSAESMLAAEVRMEQMILDLVHVKAEVAGLGTSLGSLNNTLAGSGAAGAPSTAAAINVANVANRTFASQLPGITSGVTLLTSAQHALAAATNQAADAQERQNSAQQKFGAIGGALGFLSSVPGLGFLSGPIGLLSGGASSFFGLQGAFGGGRAAGGPVSAGTSYMVGERGPEMFVPSRPGTIVPNGGMSPVINVGPARDPVTYGRDQQWVRAVVEAFRTAEEGGFRAATP